MERIEFTDDYFMRQAIQEAYTAKENDEVPVGVVVVSNNIIIARSFNRTENLKDPTAHAEILAIGSATERLGSKYLTNCTMYVTLEPCIMCAGAIAWSQLKRLVIGAKDDKRGYSLFNPSPLHPKTEVITGVLADECSELIKKFFVKKRS
ncbi:MAG: nucleoside deaminase [Marinilabiliaceae bacterium]|nr:nucleoside deaminase [Marinilabiliaceae bacterium]